MAAAIRPARLLSRRGHRVPGQLHVAELFFEVPRNYGNPTAGTLTLFGRCVNKIERNMVTGADAVDQSKPYFCYLEGGPGFGNREPQDLALTHFLLARGYQVLYLDYRGTGLSTPVNADHLTSMGDARAQADYLKLFRADTLVRDFEAVRLCLASLAPSESPSPTPTKTNASATLPTEEQRAKWSIFGQSFGGFVALTYLSKYPQGLREVFMTGGLGPVRHGAEDVYRKTFAKVVQRNEAYYRKFPEDVKNVRRVVEHLQSHAVQLPDGGRLTPGRLLSSGLSFGAHGGLDSVHSLILRMCADLDQFGFLGRASLVACESQIPFDTNPIYALLHEPLYCYKPGVASNWAAYRVGKALSQFSWLAAEVEASSPAPPASDKATLPLPAVQNPIFFTGEMVFPFHFDTYPELARLKGAAELLAACDDWPEALYDEAQLARNEVPVYAASFVDDMYVDFELARETAALIRGARVFETNVLYHNALRTHSDEVLAQLFRLRDDVID